MRQQDLHGLTAVICFSFRKEVPHEELAAFRDNLLAREGVQRYLIVSGSFDLIVEHRFADFLAYHSFVEEIADEQRRYVSRVETNFVCTDARCPSGEGLWVPTDGGRQRIPLESITKVTAEGDYMRVHTADHSWLVHATLSRLAEQLGDALVQLNRSTLVRSDLIERLQHEERTWTARLRDRSAYRISESHLKEVMILTGAKPSTPVRGSPKPAALTEK